MPDSRLDFAIAVRYLVRRVDAFRVVAAQREGVGGNDLTALGHLHLQGGITPTGLASLLAVTTSSVTELLDRLQGRGWIVRSPDPSDRRRTVLSLTAAGERVISDVHQRLAEELAPVHDALSPDELALVMRVLDTAARGLVGPGAG